MNRGQWYLSSEAITFNDEGVVTDGQHRLEALRLSTADYILTPVIIGVNNHPGMNTGKARSISDNIRIFKDCDERLQDPDLGICISIMGNVVRFATGTYSSKKYSQKDYLTLVNSLADPLIKCYDAGLFKKDLKVASSSTLAAFFLAYMNGVSLDVLTKVKNVLASGVISEDKEKPILGLREKLLTITGGGKDPDTARCASTMYCIRKVSKGHTTKGVKATEIVYTYPQMLSILDKEK